jgi:non-homologous end joining protein Ku
MSTLRSAEIGCLGTFDPSSFRNRYQNALQELVEAKKKGPVTTPRAIAEPNHPRSSI